MYDVCMYVLMYDLMYVCMYVCTCVYVGMFICVCVCMYVSTYVCTMYVCMYECMYVCIYVYVYVYLYVCMYIYIYMYVHVFTYIVCVHLFIDCELHFAHMTTFFSLNLLRCSTLFNPYLNISSFINLHAFRSSSNFITHFPLFPLRPAYPQDKTKTYLGLRSKLLKPPLHLLQLH